MQPNLDDIGGARELAFYRISVAKEDLDSAEINFNNAHYRASNNRAYYAIFRAISACLALEFKAYKQHAQVIGNFNKDFIHTGIFPKDYDDFYIVSVDEAKEQLEAAKTIVALIEEYLHSLDQSEK